MKTTCLCYFLIQLLLSLCFIYVFPFIIRQEDNRSIHTVGVKFWRMFSLSMSSNSNCSCARGHQWCGIIHYYWWTASIKPRLLFSRAGYASWGLSFDQFIIIITFKQVLRTYFTFVKNSFRMFYLCLFLINLFRQMYTIWLLKNKHFANQGLVRILNFIPCNIPFRDPKHLF